MGLACELNRLEVLGRWPRNNPLTSEDEILLLMRNHQAVKICTVKVMEVENKEKVAEKNVNKQLLTTSQIL